MPPANKFWADYLKKRWPRNDGLRFRPGILETRVCWLTLHDTLADRGRINWLTLHDMSGVWRRINWLTLHDGWTLSSPNQLATQLDDILDVKTTWWNWLNKTIKKEDILVSFAHILLSNRNFLRKLDFQLILESYERYASVYVLFSGSIYSLLGLYASVCPILFRWGSFTHSSFNTPAFMCSQVLLLTLHFIHLCSRCTLWWRTTGTGGTLTHSFNMPAFFCSSEAH